MLDFILYAANEHDSRIIFVSMPHNARPKQSDELVRYHNKRDCETFAMGFASAFGEAIELVIQDREGREVSRKTITGVVL